MLKVASLCLHKGARLFSLCGLSHQLKTPGVLRINSSTLCRSSALPLTAVAYNTLKWLHKQKSRGFKSGDLAGHNSKTKRDDSYATQLPLGGRKSCVT
jgi:hypothetical protein